MASKNNINKGVKKYTKGMNQNDKADFRKSRKALKSMVSAELASKEVKNVTSVSAKTPKKTINKITFNTPPSKSFWAILNKNSISAIGYQPLKKGELVKVTEYCNNSKYATAKPLDGREALVDYLSYKVV